MANEPSLDHERSSDSQVSRHARTQEAPAGLPAPVGGAARAKAQTVPMHSSLAVQVGPSIDTLRVLAAGLVWAGAVSAAVLLSLAGLLVAIRASPSNSLVEAVLGAARAIDGPFGGLFSFYGDTVDGVRGAPDEIKNALVNWGLAATAFLVVGRVLERVIRPATRH